MTMVYLAIVMMLAGVAVGIAIGYLTWHQPDDREDV